MDQQTSPESPDTTLIPDANLGDMLTDSSIDQIIAIDRDWNIIAWNRSTEIVTGVDRAGVLGKHLLKVFPNIASDLPLMQAMESALIGYKSFLPSDPSKLHREHFEHHFIPLKTADGKVTGVMNLIHDVAHRMLAERKLEQLNIALKRKYQQVGRASKEMETFTYVTSTNIKEPVRQLYTGLEFLINTEGHSLTSNGKAHLRRMQSSLNRMNLLLNDMLNLLEIGSEKEKTLVNTNPLMQQVIDQKQGKITEASAKVRIVGELPQVHGYAKLIPVLFTNLLDNALKFHSSGSTPVIEISASRSALPDQVSDADPEGSYHCIRFQDQGIGFRPEDRQQIFLVFEKLHGNEFRGSGMGLAICRKIMELHEGFIEAESSPGKGAAFQCFFPATTYL